MQPWYQFTDVKRFVFRIAKQRSKIIPMPPETLLLGPEKLVGKGRGDLFLAWDTKYKQWLPMYRCRRSSRYAKWIKKSLALFPIESEI